MRARLHSTKQNPFRSAAGFSMIEVLVASAILTIIVMMMGMLFQQTGLAWRTGSKRAEAYMQVRSFVGAIQRDASQAIDQYGAEMMWTNRNPSASLPYSQSFSGSLGFYLLLGDTPNRTLGFVEYDTSGNRTQHVLTPSGSWDSDKNNLMKSLVNLANPNRSTPEISFSKPAGKAANPYELTGRQGSKCLPLYSKIHVRVKSSGYAAEIGAASAGPDRKWHTKDDITTWSKRH